MKEKPKMTTEAEYKTAKAHQLSNPAAYAAQNPSDEVLANVAAINAFELAEPERSEELQRERDNRD